MLLYFIFCLCDDGQQERENAAAHMVHSKLILVNIIKYS